MSERLFRILGLIADDLIEEAGRSASRRQPWRNLVAAACVVLAHVSQPHARQACLRQL